MKVGIKDLAVTMDVKTKGVEFEIRGNDDKFRGDFIVSKAGITWCPGKTTPKNGHKLSWDEFIHLMKSA